MKQTTPILFSLFLVTTVFSGTPQDPFEPTERSEWYHEAIEEKPYQIEIVYGETEREIPLDGSPLSAGEIIDQEFMENATKVAVATSSSDVGEFEETGRLKIRFRLNERENRGFDLKLYYKLVGRMNINTESYLENSNWHVLTRINRENVDGDRVTVITAVRIIPRAETNQ